MGSMTVDYINEMLSDFDCTMSDDEIAGQDILGKLNNMVAQYNMSSDDIVDELIAVLLNVKQQRLTMDVVDELANQLEGKCTSKNKRPTNAASSAVTAGTLERSVLKELQLPMEDAAMDSSVFDVDADYDGEKPSLFAKEKIYYRGSSYSTKGDFFSTRLPDVTVVSTCDTKAYCYGGANIMFALSDFFDGDRTDTDVKDEDEPITFSGVIVPGDGGRILSAENAVLYTATRNYQLNFDRVDRYFLFPGKRVTIIGQAVKDTVNVEKIINPSPLQLAKLSNSTELATLKVCVAYGPFSVAEDRLCDETFVNFVNKTISLNTSVLILFGPFVTREAKLDARIPEDGFVSYLEALSNILYMKQSRMRVLIQPSAIYDINSPNYFPTPSYDTSAFKELNLHKNLIYLPDPAMVDVEGVRFAVSASEIIMHLSKREIYKSMESENEDRMQRIFDHIISAQSIYPLYPSDQSLPFSLKDSQDKVRLTQAPHVLILPSMLQQTVKIVDGCVAINPGRFIRGKSGASFMSVDIDLKSATSGLNDSVAPFALISAHSI